MFSYGDALRSEDRRPGAYRPGRRHEYLALQGPLQGMEKYVSEVSRDSYCPKSIHSVTHDMERNPNLPIFEDDAITILNLLSVSFSSSSPYHQESILCLAGQNLSSHTISAFCFPSCWSRSSPYSAFSSFKSAIHLLPCLLVKNTRSISQIYYLLCLAAQDYQTPNPHSPSFFC